jgi:hypothetical protein
MEILNLMLAKLFRRRTKPLDEIFPILRGVEIQTATALHRNAKCFICTLTRLNASQCVDAQFLEEVSEFTARNKSFWTIGLTPWPLLAAELARSPEAEIFSDLEQMRREPGCRIVASVAEVMIGSFGGVSRMAFGLIGAPVDNLFKATLDLPRSASWIGRELANEMGVSSSVVEIVGSASYLQLT